MSDQTVTGYFMLPNQPPMMRKLEPLKLNAPTMDFSGGKVRIAALLDLEGIAELETSLAALRVLMMPMSPDDMAAEQARRATCPDPFAWR